MKVILIDEPWMRAILPNGFPVGTSTLITGPGGSGKPLIGNVFAARWLQEGGSVVFMSLQYPRHELIVEGLRRVAGVELESHRERLAFVELDATLDGLEQPEARRFRANLVKPAVWRRTLREATAAVPSGGPGTLIFGSALNLLLFSPTYGTEILEEMKKTLRDPGENSLLFAVSSSAKAEEIGELEAIADNLLVSHASRKPFRLYLKVERMRGVRFEDHVQEVPIPPEVLSEVKEVADHSRKRVIPLISSI